MPDQTEPTEAPEPGTQGRGRDPASRLLLLVLAVAAATRVGYALSKSLVLDEFHSYFHAGAGASLGKILEDNHPPLSFWIIGATRWLFGDSPMALRSPALLFGLVEIVLVARLARMLVPREGKGSRSVPILAAAMLAASSLHFDYGTHARMYALHALSVSAVLLSLAALMRGAQRGAGGLFVLGAVVSFHTHYFGLHYMGLLVAAFLCVSGPQGLRRLAGPLALSIALCLPWALTGFRTQLSHGLAPGGDDLGIKALLESFVQLFFHNVRFGGPTAKYAFVLGSALVLGTALSGLVVSLRRPESRGPAVLVGTAAFLVPPIAWALAALLPRAGYTWHYVLPSAGAMAVLFGAGARGRLFGLAGGLGLVLAATLTALHLTRPATEDFRGAVTRALEVHAEAVDQGLDAAIVSVEWQPPLFPQGQPYDYYAPRIMENPPAREEMLEGEFTVRDLSATLDRDQVIVVRRSLPDDQFLMEQLIERFGRPRVEPFGFGLDLRIFGPTK